MKRIHYIGNFLAKHTKYVTSADILSKKLNAEGYEIRQTSSKLNKTSRLVDVIWQLVNHRKKTDLVLIDTFSTANFYMALVGSQCARILKIPYVPILHGGNLPNRLRQNPIWCKWIFKNAACNVAPSLYLKNAFEKEGYHVHYIPNIIPVKAYSFKERSHLQPTLLWVRAFEKTYHPQMAVEVLRLLLLKFPEAKLCMVGPEKDESLQETKALIANYQLQERVTLTGVLAKPAWHELAVEYDLFINTTNVDNTPVSVLEAMALGLPVVSTNVGGMPYLLEDGVDGILVSPNNPKEMAEAIVNLIEHPQQVITLTTNARKKVTQFDEEIVVKQWHKLLNDV